MKKSTSIMLFALLLVPGIGLANPAPRPAAAGTRMYVGYISDSMCGFKHMITNVSAAQCTRECVKMGAKYVLADRATGKIYELSDQKAPEKFAGEKVQVTGSLKGKLIVVSSIKAAP